MFNPQYIKDYLTEKLKCDYRISANNRELMLPSVFIENDFKRHMSINLETGLWQCFKTGKSGNFIKLYSILEDISYKSAESKLLFQGIADGKWNLWDEPSLPTTQNESSTYTLDTKGFIPVNIDSHNSTNKLVVDAWKFLMDRKLLNLEKFDENPYYVADNGKYKGRLIIPFKDYDGEIFFFQARSLQYGQHPKYLNPASESGIKSSNILYPFDFDSDHLCVCEGPSDAISLNLQGINATCTVGSSVSHVQMQTLREFEGEIILTYDNDEAGNRGIEKFENLRKKYLMPSFSVCTPPEKFKDWNEAHIDNSPLYTWVMSNKYKYTFKNKTLKLL